MYCLYFHDKETNLVKNRIDQELYGAFCIRRQVLLVYLNHVPTEKENCNAITRILLQYEFSN